jgi:hypothetical protein
MMQYFKQKQRLHIPERIIARGEPGLELAALVAAERVNIQTTGYASKGFETKSGVQMVLKDRFNLIDTEAPIKKNYDAADTVIGFGNKESRLNLESQIKHNRAKTIMYFDSLHFGMISDLKWFLNLVQPNSVMFFSDCLLKDTALYASIITNVLTPSPDLT